MGKGPLGLAFVKLGSISSWVCFAHTPPRTMKLRETSVIHLPIDLAQNVLRSPLEVARG